MLRNANRTRKPRKNSIATRELELEVGDLPKGLVVTLVGGVNDKGFGLFL
jgi:hypothetical protein